MLSRKQKLAIGADQNLAVLVGNGLSVGFNPSLSLVSITEEMMQRIESDDEGGYDAVNAMRAIAERALPNGATSSEDFELLVGAFGSERETLSSFRDLAKLIRPSNKKLRRALKRAAAFAEEVRDAGVSHVLEVIFERSYAAEQDMEPLREFVKRITGDVSGDVTIANLNYDTLMLAALMAVREGQFADMASGWGRTSIRLGGGTYRVPVLRRTDDFPHNKRIKLLHLHGSLTFWTAMKVDRFVKLKTSMLRENDIFGSIRRRKTKLRPVIVLANQRDKRGAISEYPFSLAYDVFRKSLERSTRWLIVGYSFRDEVINEMLGEIFGADDGLVRVLVVTKGASPSRGDVENAFGWDEESDGDSASWLEFFRDGAEELVSSNEWETFRSLGN